MFPLVISNKFSEESSLPCAPRLDLSKKVYYLETLFHQINWQRGINLCQIGELGHSMVTPSTSATFLTQYQLLPSNETYYHQ